MKVIPFPSSHFAAQEIPVEFLVLHYTACSLARTLEIFTADARKLCAHFVLDTNGDLYDLGGFFSGPIRQGAHAGESVFRIGLDEYRAFNKFSIGVEIINWNGNVFDYTEEQYASLTELGLHLRERFPALRDPNRVVGHEQIAGFRGKADPGRKFDWPRFFRGVYGDAPFPTREPVCSLARAERLSELVKAASPEERDNPDFWTKISSELEKSLNGT